MEKSPQQINQTRFGQIVIGPPGSGKTTYCFLMKEYYHQFNRKVLVVNLDPANDSSSLFDIDIRDLISLNEIESQLNLGPNSSFLYSFNFLDKNFAWLEDKLNSNQDMNPYFIFDSPGQIEIFTQSTSFKSICKKLTDEKGCNMRLCCVNLIESHNIFDMSKYIFSSLSVLNAMINLELPQINFLSKADLIHELKDDELPFSLSFYKNPNESTQLAYYLDGMNINPKFKQLNKKLSELIADYSLISFSLLDIKNPKHLNRAAMLIDKANGYGYCNQEGNEDLNGDIRILLAQNDCFNEEEDDEEYSPTKE